jgi:hypothetical protein
MRWAAAPQTLVSDSQLDGSARSSRHLNFNRPNPRLDFLSRLGSRFPQEAPLTSPGRANLPTTFAGFETLQSPPRGAPPVARFQSHFETFQWVAVGKSFPLVVAGGNSPLAFAASSAGICGSAKPRQRSRSLSARSARPSLGDRDPSRLARTHPRDRQHGNHDLRPRSPPPRAARRLAKRAVVSRRRRFLGCLAMAGFSFTRGRRSRISPILFFRKQMQLFWKRNDARPFAAFEGRL